MTDVTFNAVDSMNDKNSNLHAQSLDGFDALATKITRETSFQCTSYKDKCLRRRIAVRMRAHGTSTYDEYARVLDADSREYERLLDALTINVTKFFRNPSTFDMLARVIVPALWARSGPIRVWSAGCSSGEEAYSIAALFYDYARAIGAEAQLNRVSVLGTDIDRASLAAAERATYPPAAFVDTPPEFLNRHFITENSARVVIPAIRAMVRFERHDILIAPPPATLFECIVCRNVIIYFDRMAQEELFTKFYHSLSPGGCLVLGRVETLLGQPRSWFVPVDLRERIFRKPE